MGMSMVVTKEKTAQGTLRLVSGSLFGIPNSDWVVAAREAQGARQEPCLPRGLGCLGRTGCSCWKAPQGCRLLLRLVSPVAGVLGLFCVSG